MVKLLESDNKLSRSPEDPPQLLRPKPWKTSEYGTSIVKAAEHRGVSKKDISIRSQRASNDSELPQLIVVASGHLICSRVV